MDLAGTWTRLLLLTLACAPALAYPPSASAQQIYSCPQPGAPPRYQDRPCAATPAAPAEAKAPEAAALPMTRVPAVAGRSAKQRGAEAPASGSAAVGAAAAASAPAPGSTLPFDYALPPDRAETRAEYISRNERRCSAGDRRACVAVTCERSGGLGSKECQAALGYRRGPGWDLRPASDVFDPARRDDEYSLRCTKGAQRARVLVPREGGEARVYAGTAEPTTLALTGLGDFAARYCTAR